jgi:hypothetical protein
VACSLHRSHPKVTSRCCPEAGGKVGARAGPGEPGDDETAARLRQEAVAVVRIFLAAMS